MSAEDVMIAEQFYQSVPEALAVWVRDRKPSSLKQMAELADDYMLSRKGVGTEDTRIAEACRECIQGHQEAGICWEHCACFRERFRAADYYKCTGDKRCYQCGRFGHLMHNCPS